MTREPFQPVLIQQSWARFNWAQPPVPDQHARRYAAYYGIDFDVTLPGVRHGFGYTDAAGFRIAINTWMPSSARGTVWVLHGYFDHAGLYRHIIGQLLSLGFAVVLYDLPGHGLSSGPRAVITDFGLYRQVLRQCLAEARDCFPAPWSALGQSTGCAILMDQLHHCHAQSEEQPFEKVVLLAPLVRPMGYRTARVLHMLMGSFRRFIPRVFTVNSNDPDFLHFLEHEDPLQPRAISVQWFGALRRWIGPFERAAPIPFAPLVVQGDMDETVDWRFNLPMIQSKFPGTRVAMLEGARHQLANEREDYRRRIAALIQCHLD